MKIKKHPISKRYISISLILAMLFILTAGMVPTIGVAALPTHKNGTMTSARTVYCLPSSQGNGMSIGSVSSGEAVKVYWQEGSDYYIEYTVSNGSNSGYKRGYVPASSVSVSGVGSINYVSFNGKVTSTQTVYNRSNSSSMQIGSVYASDTFTILQEDGLWYYIQYPISGGYKRGYIERADIVQPLGVLEAVSFSKIVGYAYDPINPNATIQAHIYIKNNTTGVEYGHALIANIPRTGIGSASGNHGFELDINWADYPPGTYTIRLYAIRGINPQVGTATYNTQGRNSRFYFTDGHLSDDLVGTGEYTQAYVDEMITTINSINSDFASFGLNSIVRDNVTASEIIAGLQTYSVVTIQGHGAPGEVVVKVNGNTEHLYANLNGSPSIGNLPLDSMSQADLVAVLSCYSSTTPADGVSTTTAVTMRRAKVVVGFDDSVENPHYWYEYFVEQINNGYNCEEAYVRANILARDDLQCGNSWESSTIACRYHI